MSNDTNKAKQQEVTKNQPSGLYYQKMHGTQKQQAMNLKLG